MILTEQLFFLRCRSKLANRLQSEEGSQCFLSLVLTKIMNSHVYSFNSNARISSTFLSSFQVPKKVCESFTFRCVFCNVVLFSCSALKLSTSTNLPDIFKIKGWLAVFAPRMTWLAVRSPFTSEKHRSSNQTPRTMIFHQ